MSFQREINHYGKRRERKEAWLSAAASSLDPAFKTLGQVSFVPFFGSIFAL